MKLITPILEYLKTLKAQLSEAEWNGKDTDYLQREIARVEADIKNGEQWEILF